MDFYTAIPIWWGKQDPISNYKLKWKPKLILDTKAKTTIHNRRIFVNTFPCCIGKARVSASNKIAKKFPIFVSHHGNGDN